MKPDAFYAQLTPANFPDGSPPGIAKNDLYQRYLEAVDYTPACRAIFFKRLRAEFPDVEEHRRRINGSRAKIISGVRLRQPGEPPRSRPIRSSKSGRNGSSVELTISLDRDLAAELLREAFLCHGGHADVAIAAILGKHFGSGLR